MKQATTINAKCWNCRLCLRDSALIAGKWRELKAGDCLADNNTYCGQRVYVDTVQPECDQYEPRDEFL